MCRLWAIITHSRCILTLLTSDPHCEPTNWESFRFTQLFRDISVELLRQKSHLCPHIIHPTWLTPPYTPEISAHACPKHANKTRQPTKFPYGNERTWPLASNRQQENSSSCSFSIFLLKPRRASASNGSQQRLDSPVSTADPHGVTPDSPQTATAAPLFWFTLAEGLNASVRPQMGPSHSYIQFAVQYHIQ